MIPLLTLVLSAFIVGTVRGHGSLFEPPSRNSMWRFGFNTPKNYNDNGLNCGGFGVQWESNGGKCGLCGDSYTGERLHEAGGKYAPINRPIARCYDSSTQTIPIYIKLSAYHKGYFEFRLCKNNDLTMDPGQDCLDNGILMTIAGSQGQTRFDINDGKEEFYEFALDVPDVTCSQCIMQWKYNTGNSWGCDETNCGIGFGPQEQFINCADVAILDDCDGMTTVAPRNTQTTAASRTPAPTTRMPTTTTEEEEDDNDDDDVTDAPTPTTDDTPETNGDIVCEPTETYKDVPNMFNWCNENCLSQGQPYCPSTHCVCFRCTQVQIGGK